MLWWEVLKLFVIYENLHSHLLPQRLANWLFIKLPRLSNTSKELTQADGEGRKGNRTLTVISPGYTHTILSFWRSEPHSRAQQAVVPGNRIVKGDYPVVPGNRIVKGDYPLLSLRESGLLQIRAWNPHWGVSRPWMRSCSPLTHLSAITVLFYFFIGRLLLYNVVLVSAIQQLEWVINI